ncbi:MAG: glycoside hydrolase family 78 protein [Ilumatobacteraceae bacterium]
MRITDLRAEHRASSTGIGQRSPRLSWITETDAPAWWQVAYEVELDGVPRGRVESDASVLVEWPGAPLRSRERVGVRVRVWGNDGAESPWSDRLVVEAGLFEPSDWTATWITPTAIDPLDTPAPSPFLRRQFRVVGRPIERARLYVTSAGVHRLHLNGHVVGDHVLAPGWSSYKSRLRYDTHDVTSLVTDGANVLGAVVADGWWRGFLKWDMLRNVYGERLGLLAQLEITYDDGTVDVIATDDRWRTTAGPFLAADLYQGETYDARLEIDGWDRPGFDDAGWAPVTTFAPEVGALVAPPGPPVRRIEERSVREVFESPSGAVVLDFGQNLVGRVRFTVDGEAGTVVTMRHAEVLEHGEPAYRPLRNAEATDRYTFRGDGPETYEPTFTFHGFRYVEVRDWPGDLDPDAFVAVVLHSDMERTGAFSCDHELLNQLHSNDVWGMRGNFLDVPTDCPQRDERLGWTGDLQVFAPTAAFLYDVNGMIGNWLADLRAEQRADGTVPIYIPTIPPELLRRTAGWSDAVTVVPRALHEAYGDTGVLAETFDAMRAWVDYVANEAGPERIWTQGIQLGDWLDPNAPPDAPFLGRTDSKLVATAYFARSAQIVSDTAGALGHDDLQARYGELAAEVRAAFRLEYLTPHGRLMSDTVTAYSLALEFGLIEYPAERDRVAARLSSCVAEWRYLITTGFLGTPVVLPALTNGGDSTSAYRLVTQTGRPSWLYSVLMGATTMWERWDSVLPDGSVNPGEMTSFNHYAFGCVAEWLHTVVGGLAPGSPGYRRIRIAPIPGHGVTAARATLRTPYGRASCAWSSVGTTVSLAVEVPPNTTATVVRPGFSEPIEVGSGHHEWTYDVTPELVAIWRDEEWRTN